VQKTEYLARLHHLSATGGIFCIITSLLMAITFSTCAGEPVMMLAMANYHRLPSEANVPVSANLTADADRPPSPLTVANSPPAAVRPDQGLTVEISTTEMRLEKTVQPGRGEPLQLLHKNLSASSRSNVTFSVQAGYGRIWDEQSMFSKISAGHQETGCAYLGANISF